MTFTASQRCFRDSPSSASPSEQSPGRGEAFSSHAGRTRRSPHDKADTGFARLRFDRYELDEADARLMCAGEPVALAPKPFAVLCALARTNGRLVTKHALRDLVWGHQFVTDAVLKSTISKVRAALEDDPKQPRYIETVCGHGYRFIAPVVSSTAQTVSPVERKAESDPDQSALAALTALCRGNAALADLIRALAATLETGALITS